MFWITGSKTIIEPKNRKVSGEDEINDEVGDNNHRTLRGLVKLKKNSFFRKKFLTLKARLFLT